MLFYLSISLFLWILAAVSTVTSYRKLKADYFTYCCAVLFVLVAGLRFEVGYDWPAYERVFENTNNILHAISIGNISPIEENVQKMDFLYELLNSLVKSVGFDFQGLLFIIALTNALVMTNVLKRYSSNPSLCFALYFGLAYLAAQMIVIRQALASSFILLAFLNRIENKQGRVCLYSLIAVGIHFSTIMFLPFLISTKKKLSLLWTLLLLIPVVLIGGPANIFTSLFNVLFVYFDTATIVEKLGMYAAGTDGYVETASAGSVGYIIINFIVLWLIRVRMKDISISADRASMNVVAHNVTLFMLIAQIGLYQLPSFWNRIQPVALILQSIALTNLISVKKLQVRLISILILCSISNVILFYQLSKDSAAEFIPYKIVDFKRL